MTPPTRPGADAGADKATKPRPPTGSFGARLKALREAEGYTQEELATISGLSVHAVSALERGQRRRPHFDTVRALSAAFDLTGATRDAFLRSARTHVDMAVDAPHGHSPPLLPALPGREHAVSRMHAWLDKARGGECQVVFVTGEAGIGKTTLLETFARNLALDGTVRTCSGQCLEQYGISEAYLPVLEAIRQLCRDDAHVVEVLRSHAPMWLRQMPSLVTSADREHFAREAAGATRERMLREIGDVLDALTARSALVLVLEDLHWSDLSTLDLVSYIARRRRTAHLMLVGTYRPAELLASRHPLKTVKQELVASRRCEELPLEYLTPEAVGQHLAARFPLNRFPPELAALIHERTEGNPLFMVNTIDHLAAEGLIAPHEEGWQLTATLNALRLEVPDSIRQLIENQMDRLDVRDQRILEAASVAGTEFPVVAVSAALDEDLADVEARCEDLSRRHQFIREVGAQLLPNGPAAGRFGFVHTLYRHVLYDRMSASRRIQFHRRVGQRLEELHGDRANESAAELAMHFELAADYERAARYLEQAAVNDMHRWAYPEAIAVAQRGLELLAQVPDTDERARQELRLRIALGVPLIATKGYATPEVGRVYREARRLCERSGATAGVSQVLWGLWTFHIVKAELATARRIAGELLELSERVGDPDVAMRGHWAMGTTCTHQGHFHLALEHFDKALSLYDPGHSRDGHFVDALNPGVAVRCFAAWCLWFIGQPNRAAERMEEAVDLARGLAEPHGLTHALVFAAVLHQLRRERPTAQRHADAAMAVADEYGLVFYGAMAQAVRGWTLIGQGNDEQAAAQIRQGLATWYTTGARLMRPHFLALLAEACPTTGRQDEGLQVLDEALALVESTGERIYEAELWRRRGERLLKGARDGVNMEAAERCLEQSLAVASRQGARSLELQAAMGLAGLRRDRTGHVPGRDAVVPNYQQFVEGFDTIDLRKARGQLGMRSEGQRAKS